MTEQDKRLKEAQKTGTEKGGRQTVPPPFIREKIVKKPVRFRERILRFLALLILAVVMGAAAAVAFVSVRYRMEQRLYPEETGEAVVIPKDTDPHETQTEPAQTAEETEPQTEETMTEEDLGEMIQSAVDEKKLELSDYKRLSTLTTGVWKEASRGFVTITSVRQNEDWFDNVYENEGQTSGIITQVSGRDVLILTRFDKVQDTDELEVTFFNGLKAQAQVRGADSLTGLAVLNVPVSSLKASDLELITPAALGNSYALSPGTPVIAAGDPYGMVGSMAVGAVVYTRTDTGGIDMDLRVIDTDLGLPEQSGGFLLNLDGEVVAVFTAEYGGRDGAMTSAVGISNIKGIIENLCNGKEVAYMGVKGQAVTAEIADTHDLPVGVYVTETLQSGPAYRAGIQNGDVITEVDGTPVTSMRELHETLLMLAPEAEVEVTAVRKGIDEARELEFTVQLRSR